MAIINDMTARIPRIIETGFGPAVRHMTYENALTKIADKLGKHLFDRYPKFCDSSI
jgi:hypothetical protein